MAWGDPGVTESRYVTDQSPQIAAWGNAPVNLQTTRIQSAGYIRALRLRLPPTSFTGPAGTAGQSAALQAAAQLGVLRSIARFRLVTQVTSDIINVRGEDLLFLSYVGSGLRKGQDSFYAAYNISSAPQSANGGASGANYLTSQAISGAAPGPYTGTLSLMLHIPISGFIFFRRNVRFNAGNNQAVALATEKEMEVGIISVQNAQFAMQPQISLNPLSSTGVNSPFVNQGGYGGFTAGTATFDLDAEIYDVPADPANRPTIAQRGMVYSRRNAGDEQVTGGNATHNFMPSGLLLRAIYAFYDTNDNLVDISTTPNATIDFVWGTNIYKYHETMQENLARCAMRYGWLPPQGICVHDFLADDGQGIAQAPLTANLANVRAIFRGLPGSVTTMRVIEERLIPVKGA